MQITLYGRVPSKKNSRRRVMRGKTIVSIPSESHERWHQEQSAYLKQQAIAPVPPPYRMVVTFYPPTNRPQDNSNAFESVADLLVDCGILEDDNWFLLQECVQRFGGVDRANPRAEILIEEIDGGVVREELKRGRKK